MVLYFLTDRVKASEQFNVPGSALRCTELALRRSSTFFQTVTADIELYFAVVFYVYRETPPIYNFALLQMLFDYQQWERFYSTTNEDDAQPDLLCIAGS